MLALLTALLLVASLPLAAFADNWDLNDGDITVTVNGSGEQHVSQTNGTTSKAGQDSNPTIKGGNGSQSITVSATGENKANLTIENVNAKTIEVGASNATINVEGDNNKVSNNTNDPGIHVSSGNLTITGDGDLEVNVGGVGAAIGSGGGEAMSGTITIEDDVNVTATANGGGAGIGSSEFSEMSGTITIGDAATVTASGKEQYGSAGCGAGIGSGSCGNMSGTIAISNKATVKASSSSVHSDNIGAGMGGSCTPTGTIQYFDPDPAPTQPEPGKTPLYRVLNERGEPLSCTKELADGVLTITVDADFAKLIGTVLSLKTLENQGVTTITLVTKSATSTFALADLQAKGTGTYTLTHDGETVTFTLAKADVSDILK